MKAARELLFRARRGFTLVELLTVMVIIGILAGLVLGTAGYVRRKGAVSRAEAEIAALSAACESYKADNGIYPSATGTTDQIYSAGSSVHSNPNASTYKNSSLFLYKQLSGDDDADASRSVTAKAYFEFRPNMLYPSGGVGSVEYVMDPFGNSYGYSTACATTGSNGNNPTFDLWSTGGASSSDTSGTAKWIKNW